jgi:hypothetical protein
LRSVASRGQRRYKDHLGTHPGELARDLRDQVS